jgi:hypothetical protein
MHEVTSIENYSGQPCEGWAIRHYANLINLRKANL